MSHRLRPCTGFGIDMHFAPQIAFRAVFSVPAGPCVLAHAAGDRTSALAQRSLSAEPRSLSFRPLPSGSLYPRQRNRARWPRRGPVTPHLVFRPSCALKESRSERVGEPVSVYPCACAFVSPLWALMGHPIRPVWFSGSGPVLVYEGVSACTLGVVFTRFQPHARHLRFISAPNPPPPSA